MILFEDKGVGVSEDAKDRVSSQFFLHQRRMAAAFQALGLDLASRLCQILRQHTVATSRFLIGQDLDTLQNFSLIERGGITMNGFFIDDNEDERVRISRLLGQNNFPIHPDFEPFAPTKLRDALLEKSPDLVAMDFRLNDENLSANDYKGGTLARLLRESVLEAPEKDFPIVLVATKEDIRTIYGLDKTAHDLFDLEYKKEHLNDRTYREICHREILSLAKGYKAISTAINSKNLSLSSLLDLSEDELETLPLFDLAIDIREVNSVTHLVARILLKQVIGRPGPLLARNDIAAHLGLENEDVQISQILDYLNREKLMSYSGVFADGWPRIWCHRLDKWSSDVLGARLSSFSGEQRTENISMVTGLTLKPAVSKWTGKSDELFSFACSVCGFPTERRNSVALYDKLILLYLERKRVCFDCLVCGNLGRKASLSVADGDSVISDDVLAGRIPRE